MLASAPPALPSTQPSAKPRQRGPAKVGVHSPLLRLLSMQPRQRGPANVGVRSIAGLALLWDYLWYAVLVACGLSTVPLGLRAEGGN